GAAPPPGPARAPPLAAAVGEVAQQLLLLGVDRHGRLAVALELAQPGGDELELGVAVGVLAALARLAVGLQAVAQLAQQLGHLLAADAEALAAPRVGAAAGAPAAVAQRRAGVAAAGGLGEGVEGRGEAGLAVGQRLAPAARAAGAARRRGPAPRPRPRRPGGPA